MEKISIRGNYSYREILALQEKEFEKRLKCRKDGCSLPGDVVFFVEHNPVYTLGRHGKMTNLLLPVNDLEKRGIEFVEIARGGDITYHGPGQLTVYPIIDLLRYRLGVKDYVNLLEETVIATLGEYGLHGDRIEGKTGVWIGKGTDRERKISAIGIRCSRFVSMHGFAFNVGLDLGPFSGIVPCGLPMGVTSLSIELNRDISIDDAEERLWRNFTSLLLPRIPSPETA